VNTPDVIPRVNWGQFVLDEHQQPIQRTIQDLEEFQRFVYETIPEAIGLSAGDTVTLPANVADNTGAFVDATGMAVIVEPDTTYMVEGLLTFQSANVGVGIGLAFTLPAGATINGGYDHFITATTKAGGYNIASGAVSGNTAAVPIINSNNPITGRWIIKTDSEGTVQLQFRSSSAGTAVTLIQDLSTLVFKKIG
jgi:hypothetical protein